MNTISLQERIEKANAQGRVARIPFITAGFPCMNKFLEILHELDENGADIIEIGVPFSDPVADGPVVEEASRRALEMGVGLEWVLDQLKNLTFRLKAGLVLMGYYNPFLQYGLERLGREAAAVGIQGFIVPDLPLGEDAELRKVLNGHGLDLISLIGSNTDEERMRTYAKVASGYVYMASVTGTTGVRKDVSAAAAKTLSRAQKIFDLPVALGFGLHNPQQIEAMPVKPQAAVFGSALLRHLDAGGTAAEFMAPWLEVPLQCGVQV